MIFPLLISLTLTILTKLLLSLAYNRKSVALYFISLLFFISTCLSVNATINGYMDYYNLLNLRKNIMSKIIYAIDHNDKFLMLKYQSDAYSFNQLILSYHNIDQKIPWYQKIYVHKKSFDIKLIPIFLEKKIFT